MLIAMENLLMCAFKLYSWRHRANLDTNNLLNPPTSLVITLCCCLCFGQLAGQSNLAVIDATTLNDPGFTPEQRVLGFYSLEEIPSVNP